MRGRTFWNILRVLLPVAAIASVLLAANLWSYRHLGRIDLTRAKVYTISEDSKRVLAGIEEPVRITWFYDLRNKSMVDALSLLEQYARANPLVAVRGVDPAVHPAEARRNDIRFAGTAVIESGERRLLVNGGTETDFTNGLIRATSRVVQTLCFTHGHGEANPFSLKELDDLEEHDADENLVARVEIHERHGMSMARDALETLGYRIRPVLLLKDTETLEACDLVVVPGPRQALAGVEVQRLQAWLAHGGALFALLEPQAEHGLQPLLDDFGISWYAQEVIDEGHHYRSDASSPAVSDYPRHRITRGLPLSFFPGTGSFTPAPDGLADQVAVAPLVISSERSYLRGQPQDIGGRTLMLLATRRIGDVPIADGGRQARLLLAGDADFANNSHFALMGNGALFLNAINSLAQQDALLEIRPRHYETRSVQLSNLQMRLVFFTSSVLLPMLALAFGLWTWWRRR